MRIIIEGVDRVGKSTLVKKLEKIFNLDRLHFTKEDPRNYRFYYQTILKNNVVFDRHFISEYIYTKVLKRSNKLPEESFQKLLTHAFNNNVYIIVLYQKNSVLQKRMDTEPDKKVVKNFEKINEEYIQFAKTYPNKIYLIKPTRRNIRKVIKEIKKNESI